MPFTKYAVDTFISDKVTGVTECTLADLYAEFPDAKNWVSSFGLMVIFNNQPPVQRRPLALQLIRRVEMIFVEHSQARHQLLDLIAKGAGRWSPYFRALHHLESTLSLSYQAYHFAGKSLDQRLFEKKDDSPLDRLNRIYNTSKHQLAEIEQPIWITNSGMSTVDCSLTFIEIEELVRTLARIVQRLTSKQPSEDNG